MTYRFIGSESTIGPIKLEVFGQSVDLPEKLAHEAILGRCGILPEDNFLEFGFTTEELRAYPNPGAQAFAPVEFREKLTAARAASSKLRIALMTEGN